MPRLIPTLTRFIPVHAATEGYKVQKLCVEKHVFPATKPANQKFAFLWSHSNGFNKETLHPVMRNFLNHLRDQPKFESVDIDFIVWEARNHGDSARANEGTFSERYNWFDNVMDTKQVIDTMGLNSDYHKFFGVGHSFGATSMLVCEFFFPKTFDGLCLIEPVIGDNIDDHAVRAKYPTMASYKRRDTWDSKDDCYNKLAPRPFWNKFDPEVLRLYVDYGMYETAEGKVTLKCPKMQEFHIFDSQTYCRATGYHSLPTLSIPVHMIYALGSPFLLPENVPDITGKSRHITVEHVEGTHMVPNERPKEMAPHIAKIVDRVLAASNTSKL
ncbi:Alpha/Beta hydrolase protein [Fennellomyces sp. T-0311]|nr:Alpha/Beta hydrolase protein [Fennellomyces sp. T-0311]